MPKFKPRVQVGGFLQVQGVATQDRPVTSADDATRRWAKQAQIWRARFMLGGTVSRKTSFFVQTELPTPIGVVDTGGRKNIQSPAPILLDAQVEHTFNRYVSLVVGMQLVGINRNGLQSPVSLMGLEFGWFQYPYNLFENGPLGNNFGRDIGINSRGFLANDRLEWRLGVFRGRSTDPYSPFRSVFRFNYNFMDREKGLYYTGSTLGRQRLLAVGGGVDRQGSYTSAALDGFLDLPVGNLGAITGQGSYMYLSGGNSADARSFTPLIPRQSIVFTELGFYFRQAKLQPYLKYEVQRMNVTQKQYQVNLQRPSMGLSDEAIAGELSEFNQLSSNARMGGGLNYYINDFNCHVKLQYEQVYYGRTDGLGNAQTKSGGEVKLQLTCFVFQ